MIRSPYQIGHRVRVLSNGQTALVVGTPEHYSESANLLRIKFENSTRYEYMIEGQVELLPIEQQYPKLGGTYAGGRSNG
jgi:hypothetical protein